MLIDSHIHIGNREECRQIIENSQYKDIYRIYSCINPDTISTTSEFLKDVDKYFAIPLFFCETNIEEANKKLLEDVKDDEKAIPILLLSKNENLSNLQQVMEYNILKEHFTLHNPYNIADRNQTYDYLQQMKGYLLLHTLSKATLEHVLHLRKEFQNMNIILAHLGRNGAGDFDYTKNMIDSLYKDEKIYTDISTISNPELIRYAIDKFGKERVLYGSDFPYEVSPGVKEKDYMKPALMAGLTDQELEYLFSKNAEQIVENAKVKRIVRKPIEEYER